MRGDEADDVAGGHLKPRASLERRRQCRGSEGARELAESLPMNARRIQDLSRAHFGEGVRAGDFVICWGDHFNPVNGVKTLNNLPVTSKYNDALKLKEKGIATVEVSQNRPVARQVAAAVDPLAQLLEDAEEKFEAFLGARRVRGPVLRDGLSELRTLVDKLVAANNTPAPVAQPVAVQGEWVGRMNNHIGGNDLLAPPAAPDFYSKKETLVEEYRLHIFQGKSIRAGVKVKRDGFENRAHAWVRSFEGGWRIKYDDFKSKKAMRELAVKAVEALGLNFGAVDLGKKADGTYIVLEVNRAPGLEGGTTEAYSGAVAAWIQGGN